MSSNYKKKIIVVAHDAGGANILAAFLRGRKDITAYKVYAKGPAENVMKENKIRYNSLSSLSELKKPLFWEQVRYVLTGTGSGSYELNFLKEAKKRKLRTVAFIDHWVNYKERFGYPKKGWIRNIPDEVWVGDKDSYRIARGIFKGVRVKLIPNPYWKRELALIRTGGKDILFLTENHPSSFLSLQTLLKILSRYKIFSKLLVRLHPKERKEKYDKLIEKYPEVNVTKSTGRLHDDISKAGIVVGLETTALVIASLAHKKTISFILPKYKRCPLPQKNIIKLRRKEGLVGEIITMRKDI